MPISVFAETLVKLVKDNPDYLIWVPTPKKVNLLTVNWQLFLFFADCFYLLYYRTPQKVNLLTVNWQLFQVDELIAPTPAANLRWAVSPPLISGIVRL